MKKLTVHEPLAKTNPINYALLVLMFVHGGLYAIFLNVADFFSNFRNNTIFEKFSEILHRPIRREKY
jgi:hypothetical protein